MVYCNILLHAVCCMFECIMFVDEGQLLEKLVYNNSIYSWLPGLLLYLCKSTLYTYIYMCVSVYVSGICIGFRFTLYPVDFFSLYLTRFFEKMKRRGELAIAWNVISTFQSDEKKQHTWNNKKVYLKPFFLHKYTSLNICFKFYFIIRVHVAQHCIFNTYTKYV